MKILSATLGDGSTHIWPVELEHSVPESKEPFHRLFFK